MRSVPQTLLLIAALALPVLAVLLGQAFIDNPRPPRIPTEVMVGSSPGPPSPERSPSDQLPPPPPDDDADDGADESPDDLDDRPAPPPTNQAPPANQPAPRQPPPAGDDAPSQPEDEGDGDD